MPVYELSHATGSVLMIFSSFVAVFSIIFYNTIYIYTSESERNNLEKKNVQLSDDAHKDALTDLLNRRGFLPVMEALMKDERTRNFCVAFCDIDNFKRVNDSFGHDGGDEVLRHITKILRNEMQGCDICRWGGEEMVILMRDYDFAVAKEKMEYIRKLVETNPTVFYNKRIPVTITIGLEENKDIYNNPEELIKVADERMYYGKEHGKNIVISK
jgi:diguanylate cyclase (GGDEF)-like protein